MGWVAAMSSGREARPVDGTCQCVCKCKLNATQERRTQTATKQLCNECAEAWDDPMMQVPW
jgi:hypothetical protein